MSRNTHATRMTPAYLFSWSCLLVSLFLVTYICLAV
jgi:hypothetical protein